MANSTAEIMNGRPESTGGIAFGKDMTITLPTDATTALASADWTLAGYVTSDGVTMTVDNSVEELVAWGQETVKVVSSTHSVSIALSFMQTTNVELLKAIFGNSNVTSDSSGATTKTTVSMRSGLPAPRPWVILLHDDPLASRVVIPNGQLVFSGDLTFVDGESISYSVEIKCLSDANGNKAIQYFDSPKPAVVATA